MPKVEEIRKKNYIGDQIIVEKDGEETERNAAPKSQLVFDDNVITGSKQAKRLAKMNKLT